MIKDVKNALKIADQYNLARMRRLQKMGMWPLDAHLTKVYREALQELRHSPRNLLIHQVRF